MELSKLEKIWLKRACQNKAEAFNDEGYWAVDTDDIIEYFESFAWKDKAPRGLLGKLKAVNRLTPNQFFDYEELKATTLDVPSLDQIDIDHLL